MTFFLLQDMDVLLLAHLLEYLWPYSGTHLSNMRLLEQKHEGTRLANAATNAERDLVVDQCLMVGELEEIKLAT